MLISRSPAVNNFRPFSINIQFDSAQDVSLFRGLLNKLEAEVKAGGVYNQLIDQMRDTLGERT